MDYLLSQDIDGLVMTGTTGEYLSLAPEERDAVWKTSVEFVKGRVPVYAGVIEPSTNAAATSACRAERCGVDGVMVAPPFYSRPSDEGMVLHFRIVVAECGLPLVLYNNPSCTGVNIRGEPLSQLAEIDSIVAMKDCDSDVGAIMGKIDQCGESTALLSGDDDLGMPTILAGAEGAVWATPNLIPEICTKLYSAARRSDVTAARPLQGKIRKLYEIWSTGNHPGPLKEGMISVGRSVGLARAPMSLVTEEERDRLQNALAAYPGPSSSSRFH